MSNDKFPNFQDSEPAYSFQGSSPAESYLEIARMHHKESKQLFDRANAAVAEGRQEEANLLIDLGISRRERAEEFEKAARGECGDPIVDEIQTGLEENFSGSAPRFTPSFISTEDMYSVNLPAHLQPPPPGRLARAKAWIMRMIE
jgi:hypothetical protein